MRVDVEHRPVYFLRMNEVEKEELYRVETLCRDLEKLDADGCLWSEMTQAYNDDYAGVVVRNFTDIGRLLENLRELSE